MVKFEVYHGTRLYGLKTNLWDNVRYIPTTRMNQPGGLPIKLLQRDAPNNAGVGGQKRTAELTYGEREDPDH